MRSRRFTIPCSASSSPGASRGRGRATCCSRALAELEIVGVATNRALLRSMLAERGISARAVGTDFLAVRHARARVRRAGRRTRGLSDRGSLVCRGRAGRGFALGRHLAAGASAPPPSPAGSSGTSRCGSRRAQRRAASYRGAACGGPGVRRCASCAGTDPRSRWRSTGRIERAKIVVCDGRLELFRAGGHVSLRAARTEDALQGTAEADAGSLVTPLPGDRGRGARDTRPGGGRGAPLITLEAMKMEHTVTAPHAGVVERLPFALADRVAAGSVLVELKAQPAA